MSVYTKPEMAFPTFATATATFSPSKWPLWDGGAYGAERFEADGRTAAGVFIRHTSPVRTRRVTLEYLLLSTADRDAFASPGGTGFFYDAGGETFEFCDIDGTVYTARFAMTAVESRSAGHGRWDVSPIEMEILE